MGRHKIRHYLILLFVGCINLFSHLEVFFVNIMEARNFTTAREMVGFGNWLLPTMNLEPRLKKPPLPTWITAIDGMIFGFDNITALRFPAGIITLISAFWVYRFVEKSTRNSRLALISGLILLTSFYIVYMGRTNTWDIYCHVFTMGAIVFMLPALQKQKADYRSWSVSGIFLGLGFLSKGPVSFYALLLPFLGAYGLSFKYRELEKRWKGILLMLVIAIAIGIWWPIYIYFALPGAGLHTAGKESANWLNYNTRPIWYYWSFPVQSGIWAIVAVSAGFYGYMKKRVENLSYYRLVLFWTIFSLALLSVIPEKKPRYLLPTLIPMAMLSATYIEHLFNHIGNLATKWDKVLFKTNVVLFLILCFGIPIAAVVLIFQGFEINPIYATCFSVAMAVTGVIISLGWKEKDMNRIFAGVVFIMLDIGLFGLPILNVFYEPDPGTVFFAALKSDPKVRAVNFYTPEPIRIEAVWDSGRPIASWRISTEEKPDAGKPILLFTPIRDTQRYRALLLKKGYHTVYYGRYDYNHHSEKSQRYRRGLVRDALWVLPISKVKSKKQDHPIGLSPV